MRPSMRQYYDVVHRKELRIDMRLIRKHVESNRSKLLESRQDQE